MVTPLSFIIYRGSSKTTLLYIYIYIYIYTQELFYKVKEKIDTRTGIPNKTLNKFKHDNSLNPPDTKTALELIHNRFAVAPSDKARDKIALICKQFDALIIAKDVEL